MIALAISLEVYQRVAFLFALVALILAPLILAPTPAGSAMSPPPWALRMVPGKRSEATDKPFSTGASKDTPKLVHILGGLSVLTPF